jgi:KaiC/GvpD/RAD55 family RecA-like ATPase
MRYEDFGFIAVTRGSYKLKKEPILLKEFTRQMIEVVNIGTNLDLSNYFRTVYRFERGILSHVHKTGSVAGYKGSHFSDYALIEIDGGLETATASLKQVIDHLETWSVAKEQLDIDLSGGKGYHVHIPAGIFSPEPHHLYGKIMRMFVRSLFPNGWMGDKSLIDPKNYDVVRLNRLRGTKNLPEEPVDYPTGFKTRINGNLDSVLTDWHLALELWKAPSLDGLDEKSLMGEVYWDYPVNQKLYDLWRKCEKEVTDETHGLSTCPVSTGVFRFNREASGTPPCIAAIMGAFSPQGVVQLDHRRNSSFSALALYGIHQGWPPEAVKGMLSGFNQTLKDLGAKTLPKDELEKTFSSMLERRYPLRCGTSDSFLGLVEWCTSDGDPTKCPMQQKQEQASGDKTVQNAQQAYESLIVELKQGDSPFTFGIKAFDEFSGGIPLGKVITVQAYPSVGKTMLSLRLLRHLAEIVKYSDGFCMFMTPEEEPQEVLASMMMQTARVNWKMMYHAGQNGGLPKDSVEWFMSMKDTIYFAKTPGFDAAKISETIDKVSKSSGKKPMLLVYDGVTSLKHTRQFRGEEETVSALAAAASDKKMITVLNVHVPKPSGAVTKKEIYETELGDMAAHGSAFYLNFSNYLFSLYRDAECLMLKPHKMKKRWEGTPKLPEKQRLFIDKYFCCWTEEEAMKMDPQELGADPRIWFVPEMPVGFSMSNL